VLECEERGAGASLHTCLLVDVADVVVDGARRDRERLGDLLLGSSAADQPQDFHLALAEARRPGGWGRDDFMTGGAENGVCRLAVQMAGGGHGFELFGRLPGRLRGTVWARLRHGLVGVGRSQHSPGERDLGPRAATVVSRTVHALVVHASQGRKVPERGDPTENAFGVVGMEPYPLPLAVGQRPRLVPYPVRDRDTSEIVEQSSSA
jgi:hypothetical protein